MNENTKPLDELTLDELVAAEESIDFSLIPFDGAYEKGAIRELVGNEYHKWQLDDDKQYEIFNDSVSLIKGSVNMPITADPLDSISIKWSDKYDVGFLGISLTGDSFKAYLLNTQFDAIHALMKYRPFIDAELKYLEKL